MYSHESYLKHRTSIRKSQKKYYDKNKAKICSKYASIRRAWDNKNRVYLNEHQRLNNLLKKLDCLEENSNSIHIILNCFYDKKAVLANKDYLRELHSRGLI